jgi:hypothetical protein
MLFKKGHPIPETRDKRVEAFLGRVHPEFKEQFPNIVKKMVKKA